MSWKDIPCSWIGRINIVEMSILPKAILRFNTIPIKIPMASSTETEQKNPQICMAPKRLHIVKAILRKRTKLDVSHFLASNYIAKLQKSKQYSIGRKPDTQTNGTELRAQK